MRRLIGGVAALGLGIALAAPAMGDVVYYTDWTSANVPGGTASGVINVPGSANPVSVGFKAINADGSDGSLYFAQTSGGTNYWQPDAPYISSKVENGPPDADILSLVGGVNQRYVVTLSEPIKDPVMSIVSLGSPSITITYDFDSPFEIVSQGQGYWGGGSSALVKLPDDVLQGTEGHGTIQFQGVFDTFSWTVPKPETWHGFTFGIRTTEALEPGPGPVPVPLPAAAWTALGMLGVLGATKLVRRHQQRVA